MERAVTPLMIVTSRFVAVVHPAAVLGRVMVRGPTKLRFVAVKVAEGAGLAFVSIAGTLRVVPPEGTLSPVPT